jgi:L-malate glycosyltransferase
LNIFNYRRGAPRHGSSTVTIVHFLSGLAIGGKEMAALRLARRGIEAGEDHRLLLFDTPFRSANLDLDPRPVPTIFIPRGRGIDLQFAYQAARFLAHAKVDVVHAYNDTALFYAGLATSLPGSGQARLICTFHTWPSHPTPGARLLTRWAACRASTIIAVSDELRNRLLAHRWVGRCRTIWNGVDLRSFSPIGSTEQWRARLKVADDAVLVGHVARFDPIKRHHDLTEAARLLQQRASKIFLALVGQGALLQEIQELVRDYDNIRFVPQITQLAPFLRSLDLFVLCSSHEAAPLAMLEAMACGCPVVATDVGGIPAIVGRTEADGGGILVPPFRPDSLADAIESLARSPDKRLQLGANARRRAERYSFEAEWDAYRQVYLGSSTA